MNNLKSWAWLTVLMVGFIAIIATAYSLIPESITLELQTLEER